MFCVLFEVEPRAGQADAYLDVAAAMRRRVETVDGFLDVERFRDPDRPGALLSFSTWRDEKALVRWRTDARHHAIQGRGRAEIFASYRIRIGDMIHDSTSGEVPAQHRLDATETGEAKVVILTEHDAGASPATPGALTRRVFDSVMREGRSATLSGWADEAVASTLETPASARSRHFRIVRDYTMTDRREAPQYFAPA